MARRDLGLNVPHFCDSATFATIARALAALAQQRGAIPKASNIAISAGVSLARLRREFLDWAGVEFDSLLNACDVLGDEERLTGEARLFAAAHALHLRGADRLRNCIVDLQAQVGDAGSFAAPLRWGCSPSPFGDCVLGWSEVGLCHLEFFDDAVEPLRLLRDRWKVAALERDDLAAESKISAVFNSPRLVLHLVGRALQIEIWRALVARDSGETVTYGELAAAVLRPQASRAVGTAVGSNRIGWLVPCHHVLRKDGGLGGFHWGVDRKRAMLVWESLRPG